jgi:hypothetical protein
MKSNGLSPSDKKKYEAAYNAGYIAGRRRRRDRGHSDSESPKETVRAIAREMQTIAKTQQSADPLAGLPVEYFLDFSDRLQRALDQPPAPEPWQPIETKEQKMPEQIPTIGRIVHYRLSAGDAAQINRRRTTGQKIAERMASSVETSEPMERAPVISGWPAGAQAHIGNEAKEGDTFPMMITKVWGDTPTCAVNGQAYLDGNDVLWVTSASVGEGPRSFSWPTRS